jgi:parallel beta-helix repeat protein
MHRQLHHHWFGFVVPQAIISLGTIATLFTGTSLMPVYAQSFSSNGGVNAIAANPAVAKAQLFVNPGLGKDEMGAGRDAAAPFKTISFALGQAQPGMIIQLAPGSYTQESGEVFPLVVPQGVTLQGNEFNQGNSTIITGGGFSSSAWWGSQNVALWAKAESQVVGVSVTNPNSRGTGIWIEAANVAVRGCTFSKSAREGVFVAGKASATVENNLFFENSANGIALTGMSTGMVRNNTFQKTGFGIAVSEKASPQLINNRVQDNVDGIVVSHSATPQLRGNVVEGNKRDGLVAISEAKPDLGNAATPGRNTFRNNGRFAVYNATLKNVLGVEGNDVTGSVQLAANGPTGVDQNTPPLSELETYSAKLPIIAPNAVAAPTAVPAGKTVASTVQPNQNLSKAPSVQYKGKTYVLLESVTRSGQ